jgi:hypothetical protein
MDSAAAFIRGAASQGNRPRVFDWDEAARRIKARGATEASAGLQDDWEWTGGSILTDGAPDSDTYTYLASTWAIPELDTGDGREDCWRYMDETDWDSGTYWPESALAILNGPTP